jgi:hypothetical protein
MSLRIRVQTALLRKSKSLFESIGPMRLSLKEMRRCRQRAFEIAILLSLPASPAFAQIPKGGVFVGYSCSRSTLSVPFFLPDVGGISGTGKANLNGWNAAIAGKV